MVIFTNIPHPVIIFLFKNINIMIGGIIQGVASLGQLGASIAGAVKARKARKKAEKEQRQILNQMNDDNEANFLRDYYQDAFNDPTSKSYLKKMSEEFYDRNKAINSSGIATGATFENTQAQKQAANEAMGNAVNNVVVNHEQRKEAAKNRYISRKDAISQGQMDLARSSGEMKAQNWANLGSNLSDSIGGLASSFLGSGGSLLGGGSATPALNTAGLNNIKNSAGSLLKPELVTAF